jgi:hypothetical protein
LRQANQAPQVALGITLALEWIQPERQDGVA